MLATSWLSMKEPGLCEPFKILKLCNYPFVCIFVVPLFVCPEFLGGKSLRE